MLQTCELPGMLVMRFEGRMDTVRCEQIETKVRQAATAASVPIVFDLTGVDFVCSAFLRLCVFASRQGAANGFRIANVEPSIKRVFKISGLDALLRDE